MKTLILEKGSGFKKRNFRRSRSLVLQEKELVWGPRRRWNSIRATPKCIRAVDSYPYLPGRSGPQRTPPAGRSRLPGLSVERLPRDLLSGCQENPELRRAQNLSGGGASGGGLWFIFSFSIFTFVPNFVFIIIIHSFSQKWKVMIKEGTSIVYLCSRTSKGRNLIIFLFLFFKKPYFNAELQSQCYTALHYTRQLIFRIYRWLTSCTSMWQSW